IEDLRKAGATVLDTVLIAESDSIRRSNRGNCNPFKYEFDEWLAEQGGKAPVSSLDEIVRSRRYHPSNQSRLEAAMAVTQSPDATPACRGREAVRVGLRDAVTRTMDRLQLDALVY